MLMMMMLLIRSDAIDGLQELLLGRRLAWAGLVLGTVRLQESRIIECRALSLRYGDGDADDENRSF